MNKFEIYNQKVENNKNLKEIKNHSKDLNQSIFLIAIITFINTIFNIVTMAHIIEGYKIVNEILEKL